MREFLYVIISVLASICMGCAAETEDECSPGTHRLCDYRSAQYCGTDRHWGVCLHVGETSFKLGDSRGCTCEDGRPGFQTDVDGFSFGPCQDQLSKEVCRTSSSCEPGSYDHCYFIDTETGREYKHGVVYCQENGWISTCLYPDLP